MQNGLVIVRKILIYLKRLIYFYRGPFFFLYKNDNGEIIHDSKSIISDAKSFHEQLYTSKEADILDETVNESLDYPTLTNKERDIWKGLLI